MSSSTRSVAAGASLQRNSFPMGFRHLTSMDFGRLQPVVCQECVPNDDVSLNMCEAVATLAPLAQPLQTKMIMHMAAFYVPHRVTYSNWNKYITGISQIAMPSCTIGEINNAIAGTSGRTKTDFIATLSSLGYPTNSADINQTEGTSRQKVSLSLMPLRAFTRVWWDWFRDANVIPDTNERSYLPLPTAGYSTAELSTYYSHPKYAVWQHHFLTSTLKSPNGDARGLSSGTSTTIDSIGVVLGSTNTDGKDAYPYVSSHDPFENGQGRVTLGVGSTECASSSTSPTVNSLRVANALQSWLEKCNVLGYRLRDRLRGMLGSSVSAETLQMSEYLGQTSFDLNQSYNTSNQTTGVTSTTEFNAFGSTDPAHSTMAGQLHGQSTMTQNGLGNIHYHASEHGYFLVIAWCLPDIMLTDGIEPHLLRGCQEGSTRFDFLTPELVNTGFEPLRMVEVVVPNKNVPLGSYKPSTVLGWRGRYENYKYNKDRLSGCFVDPNTALSMKGWYLNRDLQQEAGVLDASGSLISGKTGSDIISNITHDTISNSAFSRIVCDSRFTVSNDIIDHIVVQFKVDMDIVRPLPAVVAPRIEVVSSAPAIIGGTHL